METGHGHRSTLIAAGPLRRVLALGIFLVWSRAVKLIRGESLGNSRSPRERTFPWVRPSRRADERYDRAKTVEASATGRLSIQFGSDKLFGEQPGRQSAYRCVSKASSCATDKDPRRKSPDAGTPGQMKLPGRPRHLGEPLLVTVNLSAAKTWRVLPAVKD